MFTSGRRMPTCRAKIAENLFLTTQVAQLRRCVYILHAQYAQQLCIVKSNFRLLFPGHSIAFSTTTISMHSYLRSITNNIVLLISSTYSSMHTRVCMSIHIHTTQYELVNITYSSMHTTAPQDSYGYQLRVVHTRVVCLAYCMHTCGQYAYLLYEQQQYSIHTSS